MLKQIELFSFESHQHTVIDLTEGINIFSGASGQGKSSIRRAIMWCMTNKPNGSAMVSWSAFDNKGTQKDPCRVILTFDDLVIERQKGPSLNGYIINNEKTLEAVGTSLPDEVATLLNVNDINYENQLDAPFLLSESSGEVARYLNRIVNLDEADRFQSEVESKRQKCNKDITTTEGSIKRLSESVESLAWLDKAEQLIGQIESKDTIIDSKEATIGSIKQSITDYEELSRKMDSYRGIPEKATALIKKIESFDIDDKKSTIVSIYDSLLHFREYQKYVGISDVIETAERKIHKINRLGDLIASTTEVANLLKNNLAEYKELREQQEQIASELSALETEIRLSCICYITGKPCDRLNTDVPF
jgi:exonuclease SbcC